jgi:hypothetical protein
LKKIIFLSLHNKVGYNNIDLEFALFLKKIIKFDFFYGTNDLKKYGYNYHFLNKIKTKYTKLNPQPIENFIVLKKKLLDYETLIITSLSGINKLVIFAKSIGMRVIVIDKYFNYDFDRNINADLILFKNKFAVERYKQISNNFKNFNYKITGTLQSSYMSKKFLQSKSYLKEKYKVKNKYALVLITGIQHHDKWYIDTTNKIIEILKKKIFLYY